MANSVERPPPEVALQPMQIPVCCGVPRLRGDAACDYFGRGHAGPEEDTERRATAEKASGSVRSSASARRRSKRSARSGNGTSVNAKTGKNRLFQITVLLLPMAGPVSTWARRKRTRSHAEKESPKLARASQSQTICRRPRQPLLQSEAPSNAASCSSLARFDRLLQPGKAVVRVQFRPRREQPRAVPLN